jgi:hypothetical protein
VDVQLLQEIKEEALQEVKDNVARADMGQAQDARNVSIKGYAAIFQALKRAVRKCGFKATVTPLPSADEVDAMKRFISRRIVSWGVEYWDEGTGHPGWHIKEPEPTLRLIARMHAMANLYNSSIGDSMLIAMGTDGAAMAEFAHGKSMCFSNFECLNPLLEGKAPKGVKAESNQFLAGCAEIPKATGECHATFKSMFANWLTPKVNNWEQGIQEARAGMRLQKRQVKAMEEQHRISTAAIASANTTKAQATAASSKSREGTQARTDAELLVAEKVGHPAALVHLQQDPY